MERRYLLALLIISICIDAVRSQITSTIETLEPSDILPGGQFLLANEPFAYGNDVVRRLVFLPSDAQKSWVDVETRLPDGTIYQFMLYVHDDVRATGASTIPVRIQIWRQSSGSDVIGSELRNIPFRLVWEARVEVRTTYSDGALYKYSIPRGVAVRQGDSIGWTYENNVGPISFEYSENSNAHRTYFRNVAANSLPLVGEDYLFSSGYLPSTFSIAVSLVPVNLNGMLFECTFDGGFCTMTQNGNIPFERLTSSTPSVETGPTSGQGGFGFYIFIESSDPRIPGDYGRIMTPNLNYLGDICVSFWYHMYGVHVGSLNVYMQASGGDTLLLSLFGAKGNIWRHQNISVFVDQPETKIVWEAVKGDGYQGDIGMDTISISDGACRNTDPDFTALPPTVATSTSTTPAPAPTSSPTTPSTTPSTTTSTIPPPSTTTTSTTTTTQAPITTANNGPTPEPPILLFSCNFDSPNDCPIIRQQKQGANWTWLDSSTSSSGTGPNRGQGGAGGYYYMETSDPVASGASARFYIGEDYGPLLVCVDFWYHMYGEHMGTLYLYVEDPEFNPRMQYNISVSGDQGDQWLHVKGDILLTNNQQVIGWEAFKGSDYKSDIAVDTILIYTGSCDQDTLPVDAFTTTTTEGEGGGVSTSTRATTLATRPPATVATTSSNTGPFLDLTDVRSKPSVLYVRNDVVATAWCIVYHDLPASENVLVEWFYPDGTAIPAPISFHGNEKIVTRKLHEANRGYFVSSLYIGLSDPTMSGLYMCKATYGTRVVTSTMYIMIEGCPPGYFQCFNKDCIEPNWVCDGRDDCTDWSDESDCS